VKGYIEVPDHILLEMERLCAAPCHGVRKYGVEYDEELMFPDGCHMAVQVCAPGDPAAESCWTQGVLWDKRGNEVGCTDVGESFAGEYCVPWKGEDYVVVIVGETGWRSPPPEGAE
jgi:hypothetical protein